MNPFEALEIAPGASFEEVKTAYHRLVQQWHPVRFPGVEKAEAESRCRGFRRLGPGSALPTSKARGLMDPFNALIGRLFKRG